MEASERFFSHDILKFVIIVRGDMAISSYFCLYDASSSEDIRSVNGRTVWLLMVGSYC